MNPASGRNDPGATRSAIEAALSAAGRSGEFLFARPNELAAVAARAAATARSRQSAVVVVGGDGTINAVAQAAHAEGCPMGVVPQGTFNYFARTHRLPTGAADATAALARSPAVPVQVGSINDRIFLVNASIGLYRELLQDREAFKVRFGRSRLVALGAALVTMLGQHPPLRIGIELGGATRDVTTPTLFVGNNRLQLEQVGLDEAPALDRGSIAAVMMRPVGSLAMFWLLCRGAVGSLGDADALEHFEFHRMVVTPRLAWGRRKIEVARDGEVTRMRVPLEIRVSPRPLYLLKPASPNPAAHVGPSDA